MAPGPDGGLYVSIPRPGGSVLVLLDRTGRPRPGWPIAVKDSTSCGLLLPVNDGSVRVVCNGTNLPQFENDLSDVRAFAFDAAGRLMAGWPVRLRPAITGRMIGDELTLITEQWLSDTYDVGQISHEAWVTKVAASGAIRRGTPLRLVETCCGEEWAIGPDGVAYGIVMNFGDLIEAPKSSELVAVSFAGARAVFPVAIDGMASEAAFDAAGRIHITVAREVNGPARTLVFDPNGRAVAGGSGDLGIKATDNCVAIEGSCEVPAAPLVGPDGTTFVIEANYNSTTVVGVSPAGRVMPGWPYRSVAGYQSLGNCCPGDSDPAFNVAAPALGPDNVVYLLHATAKPSAGGSIVAVGPDGRVRPGWPVGLRRSGAEFWSVVVGSDGTAYALAIEPETGNASSATILAIASESNVLYSTTIVDP